MSAHDDNGFLPPDDSTDDPATSCYGVRNAATIYRQRGWFPIPIAFQRKNPGRRGWPDLRIEEDDIPQHFPGGPQNVGVLLGEPSGGLADVDLDDPRCIELADEYLPSTSAVFGRPGKPRSHRLYQLRGSISSARFRAGNGTLVELRFTGLQTVFPPSTHESGEVIDWDDPDGEPAVVDAQELLAAVGRLANAVRVERGEDVSDSPVTTPQTPTVSMASVSLCVRAMMRMRMEDHRDGSARLFAACCRVVEHDLADAEGIAAIQAYAQARPFPQRWEDVQIIRRIRDAEARVERGSHRTILIGEDRFRVVDEAISVLARDIEVYQRGGSLVRVIDATPKNDGVVFQ